MEYISCAEAASAMGITVRRVQQMCKQGKLPGAVKEGHAWLIPKDAVSEEVYEKKNPTHQALSKCSPKTSTAILYYNIFVYTLLKYT